MKKCILVIDDSEMVRDNIKELLELSDYSVLCGSTGKEGLELAREHLPNLILCDIMMPELDGYGVLRALSNNPHTRSIPFIFLTALAEKLDQRKGMDLGADDYLIKPFSGEELLSLIGARLKKSEMVQELIESNIMETSKIFLASGQHKHVFTSSDKVQIKLLKKKDTLYFEGEFAKYLYYIISGKVKTVQTNEQGKVYITEIYVKDNFLGFQALMEEGEYADTAVVMENTEIVYILKQDFQQLLLSNPELQIHFTGCLASEICNCSERLVGLAYNSARKRVAEAILFLGYKTISSDKKASFPASRDDISALSGVSPESVSRNLTDLKHENLIEFLNGKLKVLDLEKLQSIKN